MLGERLRQLRQSEGISQRDLADRLFVSQQTVAKWEKESTSPNPDTLRKIADVFNVSVDFLVGRTEKESASKDAMLKFALFGVETIDDEAFEEVKRFARYVKERNKNDQNGNPTSV